MKKFFVWMLVSFAVLILAIVVVVLNNNGSIKPQAAGEVASLIISPKSGTYKVGAVFSADIVLDTGGQAVEGTDLRYIRFDPQVLEVQDADADGANGVQITPKATALTVVGQNQVDPVAGTILLSLAVPEGSTGFTGSETIATISFKALKEAATSEVKFDFTLGDLADTNVTSLGSDILGSAVSANYIVEAIVIVPEPTVKIMANGLEGPIEVESGQSITLSWVATPEDITCQPSGGWTGDAKAATGSEIIGNLTQAKTFVLTCTNISGQATDSVVVNVKSLPVLPDVTLKVNDKKQITVKAGVTVALTWTSANAKTCVASGNWSGSKTLTGGESLGPINNAKTYILTCSNETGSVHDRATVYLEDQPAPVLPTIDLKANNSNEPTTVDFNQSANLSWTSTNADSCEATNGWSGSKPVSGEESTGNLTESKTYTLTCKKGESIAIDSITINVSGQEVAEPGPSDGNQLPPESSTINSSQVATQIPDSVVPAAKTATSTGGKTQQLYRGGVIKPWAMWLFYALIPVALTAGVVFFYLWRKRRAEEEAFDDTNTMWPNYPV